MEITFDHCPKEGSPVVRYRLRNSAVCLDGPHATQGSLTAYFDHPPDLFGEFDVHELWRLRVGVTSRCAGYGSDALADFKHRNF